MLGVITVLLLILSVVTGMLKRRKLYKYLALLTAFSLALHLLQYPYPSPLCFLILLFFSLTLFSGLKSLKSRRWLKFHIMFAVITVSLTVLHLFYVYVPKEVEISGAEIILPKPRYVGEMSLEEALLRRRSIRDFRDEYLKLEQLSQILWAAQGITSEWGGRTAPSAGATYPLELYVAVRKVHGIKEGIYHYIPTNHSLINVKFGDYSTELMMASLGQRWVKDASVNVIVTADFSRTMRIYGERGRRYVYLEAGHAAQNVYLQVAALNLGCVVVGAFIDDQVQRIVGTAYEPIYIIPIGVPKG